METKQFGAGCSSLGSWRKLKSMGVLLDVVFRQIEIVLKDSTAFVYVTKSEKSSHFTLMT